MESVRFGKGEVKRLRHEKGRNGRIAKKHRLKRTLDAQEAAAFEGKLSMRITHRSGPKKKEVDSKKGGKKEEIRRTV